MKLYNSSNYEKLHRATFLPTWITWSRNHCFNKLICFIRYRYRHWWHVCDACCMAANISKIISSGTYGSHDVRSCRQHYNYFSYRYDFILDGNFQSFSLSKNLLHLQRIGSCLHLHLAHYFLRRLHVCFWLLWTAKSARNLWLWS